MNILICLFFTALSVFLIQVFYKLAYNTKLMDKPNERSLHSTPKVRGAGVVFIGLSLLSLPFICYFTSVSLISQFVLILSIALIASISFLDDLFQLSAKPRFLIQLIVSLLVAVMMRPEQLNFILFSITNYYLIVLFLLFAGIWAINHFNFMDGLDGFCASQALFLLAVYSFLFYQCGDVFYQSFCLILLSSILGFLIFNFPPAKLFMGDVGSASLGFITFTLAVIAQQTHQIPILYWFLLNALFLFDASLTLIRRIGNGEQWFIAHRKHAYQRIRQFGLSPRAILLGQSSINIIIFIFILLFQESLVSLGLILLLQFGSMLLIYLKIEKCFPMFQKIN